MKTRITALLLALLFISYDTMAFCGFYVSKAPADLFNKKSEVILVRDGKKTTITMSNDFQGDVKDFAMVVPVPVVLKKNQIRIADRGVFDRLDAYSAPRLVEYHDQNPCAIYEYEVLEDVAISMNNTVQAGSVSAMKKEAKEYKVTIEAKYEIGEYDILILSAKESSGLERWLVDNGYKIPSKAKEVLEPYVKNNIKFFVVKVNLEKQQNSGFEHLSPIQISFESDRFMLPIRLGMANAKDEQDLIVYAFTREGRVEPTNYRTVKIPSNRNVPLFVERYFGDFYKDLFNRAYYREKMNSVFLEYAWNVSPMNGVKCDPCVSPPPVFADFKESGVDWVTGMNNESQVFFTRLHVRYTRNKFPQDLQFQVTPNRENFQARYILTHPAQGDLSCRAGQEYIQQLEQRRKVEVDELYALAGWTNPNYAEYIKEYSKYKNTDDYDKYAPNKNEVLPPGGIGDDVDGPSKGYFFLVSGVMFLLLFLARHRAAIRQRRKRFI